jgi:hypothetical protein
VKVEEYTQGVGAIITNLLALETVLRYFLAKEKGEDIQFPKVGDKLVKLSWLTRFGYLSDLINRYNKLLKGEEKKYEVDTEVNNIRNSIAHGRLVTTEGLPFRLWMFGRQKRDNIRIKSSQELTAEWLKETSAMINREKQKVLDCFAARKYQGLR